MTNNNSLYITGVDPEYWRYVNYKLDKLKLLQKLKSFSSHLCLTHHKTEKILSLQAAFQFMQDNFPKKGK